MEKIALIIDRLNMPPFNKNFPTLTEFDSKSSLELLEYSCEIVVAIDPDQESIHKETIEFKVRRIIQFLMVMKFNIPEDQMEDFQSLLMTGDKEILHTIMHWCLQRFDQLQKRAYLAKFLMPIDIPPDFLGDDLVQELSARLKEMQAEFKEVHKSADKVQNDGARPAELKAEIAQLEQEKTQLENKIRRMKKDSQADQAYFDEMLKATSALRKEQEEEVRIHDRIREHRMNFQEVEQRFAEANKRLSGMRSSGVQNQSAEQLLAKLQKDVKEMIDRRDTLETACADREAHLEKLQGWENSDRVATEDDVRAKREQVRDMEEQVASLQERLDAALEKNTKLTVFRQASTMAMKKLREREEEIDKLTDEKRRLGRLTEEKEQIVQSRTGSNKMGKKDLKKYGAVVRDKIEKYKRMREELSSLRAELVTLQRTEQILKGRMKNLDEFLADLERKRGVEGYRSTQRALVEMSEKAAEVDQLKGATLEQISSMVDKISREFKAKQAQLQPLMQDLKNVRQEFMDLETEYNERKSTYDKVAVGLEMEKQGLEKECDACQEECLREESRFHYLNALVGIARVRLERAEQERKWQAGDGRMMRDFSSFKELYTHKLAQQDQLSKQLRKRQKELKENAEAMTNQKTNFLNLQALLAAKIKCETQSLSPSGPGGGPGGMPSSKAGGKGAFAETMSFNY